MYQYNKIIDLAIKLGKYDDAFKYIQFSKSRSLSERVLINSLLPKNIPKSLQEKYIKFKNLKDQLISVTLNCDQSDANKYIRKWFAACRSHRALIESINKKDPAYVNLVNSPAISPAILTEAIKKCPPGTVIIDLFVTYTQAVCVVISNGINIYESIITIPEININALSCKVDEVFSKYREELPLLYFDETYISILDILGGLFWKSLKKTIERLSANRILFIPHKELHLLPLHLIKIDKSMFLCEKYEVCYVPNYNIFRSCLNDSVKVKNDQVLIVENPDNSLRFAKPEAKAIQSFIPRSTILCGEKATRQAVLDNLEASNAIHFITHGVSNDKDIRNVKLLLSDGYLSFEDILANYRFVNCQFAFLSACKTAIIKVDEGDEYIGLNHAFFYSGVKAIISSLWPVNDSATMLFVWRWYHNRINLEMSKSSSLREAQLWLKNASWSNIKDFLKSDDFFYQVKQRYKRFLEPSIGMGYLNKDCIEKPFSHPYFWAPFCCYGNWN